MTAIHELINSFDLLYMSRWKGDSHTYKQSVMGLLWAILMPILIVEQVC